MIIRTALASVLLAASVASSAMAEQVTKDITAKSGDEVEIGVFSRIQPDCTMGEFTVKVASVASNGTIARREAKTKPGRIPNCPDLQADVVMFLYKSKRGFTGKDRLAIEFSGGAGQQQTIQYDVTVE